MTRANIDMGKVLIGALAITVGVSCSGPRRPAKPPARAAVSLVNRFVAADMRGSSDSALGMLKGCDVSPSADFLEPTIEARILGATPTDSTVRVAVRYVVLGRLFDTGRNEVRWQFTPGVQADTITYTVVQDSSKQLWIKCGYYPPNHADVSAMEQHIVKEMDGTTRGQWTAALAAAGRLR